MAGETIGTKSAATDVQAILWLAVLVFLFFLPIAIFVPAGCADDGGYARILEHFLRTGIIDLMYWSQPNLVGLVAVAAPIVSIIGLGFRQLDLIGILYAVAATIAVFKFARKYLNIVQSIVVSTSLFCFLDITMFTPTFMTDMPFLAYCAWWLYFTAQIMERDDAQNTRSYMFWCVTLSLAMLTRTTIILFFPGILAAAVICSSDRRKLLTLMGLFLVCVGVVGLINRLIVVNQLSIFELTALKEIFVNCDWGRLNLRATAFAFIGVLIAISPLMIGTGSGPPRLNPSKFCLAILFCLLCSYFSLKEHWPFAPLVVLVCTLSAFCLPQILSKSLAANRALCIILVTSAAFQFLVMPVTAHPLMRHAIPIMLTMSCLCAMANNNNNQHNKRFLNIYIPLASLLILNNLISAQQDHLVQFARWEVAHQLVSSGIKAERIDAGWAWFCFYGLEPGVIYKEGYQERYKEWQTNALLTVDIDSHISGGHRLLGEIPVNYLWRTQAVRIWCLDRFDRRPN